MRFKSSDGRTGIYRIRCRTNGLIYVGQCKNFGQRASGHRKMLRQNRHYNKHLQGTFNKYGEDSFVVRLVLVCDERQLTKHEQRILDRYRHFGVKTANKMAPVQSPMLGTKRPDAVGHFKRPDIRALGQAAFEKWRSSPEGSAVMSETGRRCMATLRANPEIEAKRKKAAAIALGSVERREVARLQMKTRWEDPEQRRKFVLAQDEHAARGRKAVKHLPSGRVFLMMTDAAEWCGVSIATISKYLNGKGGYKKSPDWVYFP